VNLKSWQKHAIVCLSFVSYNRLLVGKIIHKYTVTSSLKEFQHTVRIKFPTKRIFRIFPILRIDGIME